MIAFILHIIAGMLIAFTFVAGTKQHALGNTSAGAVLWASALVSFTLLIKL
jgi:hypothetical protein